MNFFDYLKNIFLILIFLQFAPVLIKNVQKQYDYLLFPRVKIGKIKIGGVLKNSDYYNKYLNKYFNDPEIKGILLSIDCPGSTSGTSQAIFNEIKMLKKKHPKKPIISLVENVCASGGYYIACATDAIIAPPSSIIGSIGSAFQYLFQLKEFAEQFKIKYKSLAAGKFKTTTDPFTDMTEEQQALLQSLLDDSYDQFSTDVSKERKLSLKNKSEWAEGKIFTGSQALKLGLIDQVGSAYNAEKIIREKALIETDKKIKWVKAPLKTGIFKWFGEDPQDQDDSMFTKFTHNVCTFLENRYLS